METKLRKVQKVTILTYLKILFAGRCWNSWIKADTARHLQHPQAHQMPPLPWWQGGWSSPALENGDHHHCHPLRDQESPKSVLQWNWVPGLQLNKCSNLPFLHPSDQEGTTEVPVTDQLALLTPQTCLQVQHLKLQCQVHRENWGVPVSRSLQLS